MSDTTTPNLGLTKPAIGASRDTWGGKINGDLDILDSSVLPKTGGTLTGDLWIGTSGTPHNLTVYGAGYVGGYLTANGGLTTTNLAATNAAVTNFTASMDLGSHNISNVGTLTTGTALATNLAATNGTIQNFNVSGTMDLGGHNIGNVGTIVANTSQSANLVTTNATVTTLLANNGYFGGGLNSVNSYGGAGYLTLNGAGGFCNGSGQASFITNGGGRAGYLFEFYGGFGTRYAMIDGAGQFYKPGGGMFADSSDARLKEHVTDYPAGLAEVCQLRPVTFQFNGLGGSVRDGLTYHGLIAQEAQQAMPELIGSMRERLHPDDAEATDLLTVSATPLLYALVSAVKELAGRVAALEAER